jgi:hypothetical protein
MMAYCALELGRKQDALAHLKRAADFPELTERAGQLMEHVKKL